MIIKSKNKTRKIISNLAFTIFMTIMIFLIFITVQSRMAGTEPSLFGNRLYIVDSGSMMPTINVNSLIIVKEKLAEEIEVGDIITYYGRERVNRITHRVVDKVDNGEAFITRGDANNTDDPNPLGRERLIGKVIYSLPYIGYVFRFLSSTPGIVFIISLSMLWVIAPSLFKEKEVEN